MSETETANKRPDPRTTDVLRALQRARGMVADAARSSELPPLHEVPSNGGRASQDVLERLASSVRFLETALGAATEKLTDLQRSQDRAVRELHEAVQGLKHQADVLAGWHAWGTRRVAAWGLILGVLVGAAVALSWRTHAVALSTHAVLEQILENQARAQAAKIEKRHDRARPGGLSMTAGALQGRMQVTAEGQ
jgi:hypothetical protein